MSALPRGVPPTGGPKVKAVVATLVATSAVSTTTERMSIRGGWFAILLNVPTKAAGSYYHVVYIGHGNKNLYDIGGSYRKSLNLIKEGAGLSKKRLFVGR